MQRLATTIAAAVVIALLTSAAGAAAGTWAVQTTANPGSSNFLDGVSCTGTSCVAVGSSYDGKWHALAERFSGRSWSAQAAQTPAGAQDTLLQGDSCTSSNSCVAVGSYTNSGGARALTEHWDGVTWSTDAAPTPTRASGDELYAVSCPSATDCTAVGDYLDRSGSYRPLAERWNGTSWAVQPTPALPHGAQGRLFGVSCPRASTCLAVGQSVDKGRALAERWNGTTWSVLKTVQGGRFSFGNDLSGVSCAARKNCTAVGFFTNSFGEFRTLIEHWDGTRWTRQPSPDPNVNDFLFGVSCASATACSAVGRHGDGHRVAAVLAVRWNGKKWSVQTPAKPSGATRPRFSGVSCPSVTSCTAVGSYDISGGILTLAERWSG
jgi:hypothetical protein